MQIYDVPTAQATILRRGMWDEVEVSKEMAEANRDDIW